MSTRKTITSIIISWTIRITTSKDQQYQDEQKAMTIIRIWQSIRITIHKNNNNKSIIIMKLTIIRVTMTVIRILVTRTRIRRISIRSITRRITIVTRITTIIISSLTISWE